MAICKMQNLKIKLNVFRRFSDKTIRIAFPILVMLVSICVFVPFIPNMPGPNLDDSWMFGMNQAVQQGLVFGRDIIFTFGPYASIYTKSYHPATDWLMIYGSLYLAISFGLAITLVAKKINWISLIALSITLTGLMYLRDPLLYTYPLLVAIFSYKLINGDLSFRPSERSSNLLVVLVFFPLGFLPLIKGTVLILCLGMTGLVLAFFLNHKKWKFAIFACVSSFASLILFWEIAGQSIVFLPNYLASMLPIVSGYTEAMAVNGLVWEIYFYLIASTVLLISIAMSRQMVSINRIYIFAVFSLFLFLAFKAGFVRHDGHSIIAGTSLLIGGLLLTFISYEKIVIFSAVLSFATCIFIDSNYAAPSFRSVADNVKATFFNSRDGLRDRIESPSNLHHKFDDVVLALKTESGFPVLEGTTDIYSYNQSHLIASGNIWNPRPVLQSYSAYTPRLTELNMQHLIGAGAPDNILFKIEPIDGRMPSIEDGASWPILLTDYEPSFIKDDYLYLKRNNSLPVKSEEIKLSKTVYTFGENVPVPDNAPLIFVNLNVKQTLAGQFAKLLFKPSQLAITINFKNNRSSTFRLISGMANSRFLISPLIENSVDFSILYSPYRYRPELKVKSFSIKPVSQPWQWKDSFDVGYSSVAARTSAMSLAQIKFDDAYVLPSNEKMILAAKCDGNIDSVNGESPKSASFSASGILEVGGWMAISASPGVLSKKTFLILTDKNNQNNIFQTRQVPRNDVGAYFKNPVLNSAGYETRINTSKLKGEYTLSLGYEDGDEIKVCPGFHMVGSLDGSTF